MYMFLQSLTGWSQSIPVRAAAILNGWCHLLPDWAVLITKVTFKLHCYLVTNRSCQSTFTKWKPKSDQVQFSQTRLLSKTVELLWFSFQWRQQQKSQTLKNVTDYIITLHPTPVPTWVPSWLWTRVWSHIYGVTTPSPHPPGGGVSRVYNELNKQEFWTWGCKRSGLHISGSLSDMQNRDWMLTITLVTVSQPATTLH